MIEPNRENSLSPNKSQEMLKYRRVTGKNTASKLKIKTILRPLQKKEAHTKNVLKSIITSSVTKVKPLHPKLYKRSSQNEFSNLQEATHGNASKLEQTLPQSKSVASLPALNFLKSSTNDIIKKSFEVNASISQLRQSITKSQLHSNQNFREVRANLDCITALKEEQDASHSYATARLPQKRT